MKSSQVESESVESEASERILLRLQARELTEEELNHITGGMQTTASGNSCTACGDEDCGSDD